MTRGEFGGGEDSYQMSLNVGLSEQCNGRGALS